MYLILKKWSHSIKYDKWFNSNNLFSSVGHWNNYMRVINLINYLIMYVLYDVPNKPLVTLVGLSTMTIIS